MLKIKVFNYKTFSYNYKHKSFLIEIPNIFQLHFFEKLTLSWMKVSLFNCRMDIWYVLKSHGFNYSSYYLKQLIIDKYLDCWQDKYDTLVCHYILIRSVLFTENFYFLSPIFRKVKKKNVSAIRETYKITML